MPDFSYLLLVNLFQYLLGWNTWRTSGLTPVCCWEGKSILEYSPVIAHILTPYPDSRSRFSGARYNLGCEAMPVKFLFSVTWTSIGAFCMILEHHIWVIWKIIVHGIMQIFWTLARPAHCTISKKIPFINITIHLIRKTFNYGLAVKFPAVEWWTHVLVSVYWQWRYQPEMPEGHSGGPLTWSRWVSHKHLPFPKPELPPDTSLWSLWLQCALHE